MKAATEHMGGVKMGPDVHDQIDDEDNDDDADEPNGEKNGQGEIESASGSIDTNGYLTNRELGEE